MFFVTNVFNLPLLIMIWLIEAFLFLAVVRLILANVQSARQGHMYQQVKFLTDLFPDVIGKGLAKVSSSASIPSWLPWVITVLLLLIIRQILVQIVIM